MPFISIEDTRTEYAALYIYVQFANKMFIVLCCFSIVVYGESKMPTHEKDEEEN